jgi:hypothetical protein
MRNTFIGAISLFAITAVVCPGFVMLPGAHGQSVPDAAPTTAPVDEAPMLLPVRPPFAKGPIRELDPMRKTVVIETRDGLVMFVVTDRTLIFRGPEKLTLDKLALGDILAVRFNTDADDRKVVSHAKVYPNPAASVGSTNETERINTALPPRP